MPEKENLVGASHDFHDLGYARWWAERFTVTEPRRECFELIASRIPKYDSKVLELGCGPGYLALHLLSNFPDLIYHCADYSQSMLDLASSRLNRFQTVAYHRIDLLEPTWHEKLPGDYDLIVSTWALHDLGSEIAIVSVYDKSKELLVPDGAILNADFIKPKDVTQEFEAGRFPVERHLAYLEAAGFRSACCLGEFEQDLRDPKSHNNYACMYAES